MRFFLPPPEKFRDQKRIVDIGPKARIIVDTGPAAEKISPELVMKSLGAEPMAMNQVKSRSLRFKTFVFAAWCLFWVVVAALCGFLISRAYNCDSVIFCISAACAAAICLFGVWYAYRDVWETPEKS